MPVSRQSEGRPAANLTHIIRRWLSCPTAMPKMKFKSWVPIFLYPSDPIYLYNLSTGRQLLFRVVEEVFHRFNHQTMVGHGDAQEDFTFPTVVGDHTSLSRLNFSQFSPSPFWFVSKTAPEPAEVVVPELRRGKSFSEAKNDRLRFDDSSRVVRVNSTLSDAVGARFLQAEETMDMLWEDLNEELGVDTAWKMPSNIGKTNISKIPELDQAQMEDLSNVKEMKNSKRGSLIPHSKSSFPVMFKVLKKLFLIHSPTHHKKV